MGVPFQFRQFYKDINFEVVNSRLSTPYPTVTKVIRLFCFQYGPVSIQQRLGSSSDAIFSGEQEPIGPELLVSWWAEKDEFSAPIDLLLWRDHTDTLKLSSGLCSVRPAQL
jgi:hypothetical protein